MEEIIVIGAGVAGLSVAWELLDRAPDAPVRIYEAAEVPGGNIHTDHVDGFTIEWGPNGFLDNVPETLHLIDRLGISDRLLPASQASKRRYIWRRGRLHEVKANPVAFLASGILSWPGKLRILAEPFTGPPPEDDQTVYEFAVRHIGAEAASILVDAMTSGVFAGDERRLSLRSAFPKMHEMEQNYRSLVRAMLARQWRRKRRDAPGDRVGGPAGPAGHLTSFKSGMAELIAGLVRAVGPDRIAFGNGARSVEFLGPNRFRVALADGTAREASAAVIAVPAWDAAPLVRGMDGGLGGTLEQIPGAPVAVVALAFRRAEVAHPMDGFGFLVPRGEGLRILGSLWTSSIFPGRAPEGFVLLRTMVGGAHSPEYVGLDDERLVALVREDLRTAMGIEAEPVLSRIYRYGRGIPQYLVGHAERLRRIEAACARLAGLHVAGNSYEGIAVNSCIRTAGPLAERLLAGVGAS